MDIIIIIDWNNFKGLLKRGLAHDNVVPDLFNAKSSAKALLSFGKIHNCIFDNEFNDKNNIIGILIVETGFPLPQSVCCKKVADAVYLPQLCLIHFRPVVYVNKIKQSLP